MAKLKFDDDTDFLLGQKDNFIHVDEQKGLTDKDVEKARKILKTVQRYMSVHSFQCTVHSEG